MLHIARHDGDSESNTTLHISMLGRVVLSHSHAFFVLHSRMSRLSLLRRCSLYNRAAAVVTVLCTILALALPINSKLS